MKNEHPLLTIIVPVKNSAELLENFFKSLLNSTHKNFEVIINDDKESQDNTKEVTEKYKRKNLTIRYLRQNLSVAQARKRASQDARGKILLHLDSDMQVTPTLLEECVALISKGLDAAVIPEESFGTTFWAKCKWLEKKCYEGVETIESLRLITMSAYKYVDGHNEKMVFSEDKDLDLRVQQAGFQIGRTKNKLLHDEGNLKLLHTLRKKRFYAETANFYAIEHPREYKKQKSIIYRYSLFLKSYKYFLRHPLIYIGMIIMKTLEFLASGFALLTHNIHKLPLARD